MREQIGYQCVIHYALFYRMFMFPTLLSAAMCAAIISGSFLEVRVLYRYIVSSITASWTVNAHLFRQLTDDAT